MISVSSTGVVIALAVLAIVGCLFVPKLRAGKVKRAEKWEKATIMRQLLALSERENGLAATEPPVRVSAPASRLKMRATKAPVQTTAKTTLPIRSKNQMNTKLHRSDIAVRS
jgi:hypothetical protein